MCWRFGSTSAYEYFDVRGDPMRASIETVPSVEYQVSLRGEGTVSFKSSTVALSLVTARRSKYRPDHLWEVTLRVSSVSYDQLAWTLSGSHTVHGEADDGTTFVLDGVRTTTGPVVGREDFSGECQAIAEGVRTAWGEISGDPPEQAVLVLITATRLALPLIRFQFRSEDGQMTGERKRDPFSLRTPVGPGEFWQGYEIEDVRVSEAQGTVELPQPMLGIAVPKEHRTLEPTQFFDELQPWLDDLCVVLGFLDRRHVGHFLTRVTTRSTQGDGPSAFHFAEAWTAAPEVHARSDEPFGLVAPGRLGDDSIQRVLDAYQSHELKEAIGNTIAYILESFGRTSLPTATTFAFTALETIVNALGELSYETQVVEPSVFKKVAKRLRQAIRSICEELGLGDETADAFNSKLAELRRRAFVDRVVEIVVDLGVAWQDLWPGAPDLGEALRATYSRRSNFIHQGVFTDAQASSRDSYRVAYLAERIVYALLGGAAEWLPEGGAIVIHQLAPADINRR